MAQIDIITKCKVALTVGHPFFGSLALRYPCEESKEIPTMCTDGKHIWFNREWTEGLEKDEVTGVLAHEVCHMAFLHHVRRGERNPHLWNIAGDFVINNILIEAGFKLPKDGCIDKKYEGMTTEKVYELLMDDIKNGKIKIQYVGGGGLGEGSKGAKTIKECPWGGVTDMTGKDGKGASPSEKSMEESEMKVKVLQAAHTAKSKGKLPSAFDGLINDFKSSKVNWRERLRTFVGGNKPDDWSYRRPNRKHMALNSVYLPTIEFTGAGIICLIVDSSGSVSNDEIAQFLGEIKSIHSEMRPEELHVIWVDAQVQHTDFYSPHDEFDDKKRYACGGTAMQPGFEWIEKQGIQPHSIIVFSDMELFDGDCKSITPPCPVLWVATGNGPAPIGEVIRIHVE